MISDFIIQEPIWDGEKVGIAQYRFNAKNELVFEIGYKDKFGNRPYPSQYKISIFQALSYPKKIVGRGVIVNEIPIRDLEVVL